MTILSNESLSNLTVLIKKSELLLAKALLSHLYLPSTLSNLQ